SGGFAVWRLLRSKPQMWGRAAVEGGPTHVSPYLLRMKLALYRGTTFTKLTLCKEPEHTKLRKAGSLMREMAAQPLPNIRDGRGENLGAN
ncbi:MAG: hypothetical protein AAF804_04815, partial [Bacteroidota bacterium]